MSKGFKEGDWVWDRDRDEVAEVESSLRGYVGVCYEDDELVFMRADALLSLREYSSLLPVDRRRP